MTAKIISGKDISSDIKNEAAAAAAALTAVGRQPTLAVIVVGEDPASRVYVNNKKKACVFCGINSPEYAIPYETTQETLLRCIDELNRAPEVDGILCQLPLPAHIDENAVIDAIDPKKDVDGFSPVNAGNLLAGKDCFLPCTPAGIIEMLRRSGIQTAGKHCVILGRSNIVGKPAAVLMLRENATVTVCHSKTKDLKSYTKSADILIAAIGKPNFVTADMVKPGAAVIDVGINRTPDGKLCGDVDFEHVKEVAGAISPVPGGVGPMTIAMLMHNTVKAAQMHINE